MYDPEGLIGDTRDIGITLALLPRDTAGVEIGRRAMPLNSPFQNGPIRGKDVFIPLSQLIGGEAYAGKGWQMLVECLSIGRSITLPSTASGGSKFGAVVTGAYARIRKQFGLSVGRFEGVEEALARIGGKAYAISALSQATAAAVDRGDVPSVPSAIAKYHCTTSGREERARLVPRRGRRRASRPCDRLDGGEQVLEADRLGQDRREDLGSRLAYRGIPRQEDHGQLRVSLASARGQLESAPVVQGEVGHQHIPGLQEGRVRLVQARAPPEADATAGKRELGQRPHLPVILDEEDLEAVRGTAALNDEHAVGLRAEGGGQEVRRQGGGRLARRPRLLRFLHGERRSTIQPPSASRR